MINLLANINAFNSKKILYLSTFIAFSIIAFYNLKMEYCMCGDAHTYSEWADDLINLNFNFQSYYEYNNFFTPSIFYTVPVTVVALFKFFFGSGWQYAFFILNLMLVLFSMIILVKSLLIIEVRPVLISLTILALVASPDLLLWPQYILSETIFAFEVLLCMYFIIKGITLNKINYVALIFIISLLLLSRPSSVPIVFAVLSYLAISRFSVHFNSRYLFLLFISLFIISPVILSILYIFVDGTMTDPNMRKWILDFADLGMIIHDRPETWITPPESFYDYSYLYFIRMLNFFTPYVASFSTLHIALNSLEAVIILSSLIIWGFLAVNIQTFNNTILLILMITISLAVFHSFTVIDYDFRYRFPIIMPLMMIFPIVIEALFRKINSG